MALVRTRRVLDDTGAQVFVTTTDARFVPSPGADEVRFVRISRGRAEG